MRRVIGARGALGRWIVALAVAAVAALALLDAPRQIAGLAWSSVSGRPPLRVRRIRDQLIVDVQTLGEYPTTVAAIRLSRGTETVWEVKARERAEQIRTFGLRVGENDTVPLECKSGTPVSCEPLDGYEAATPASAPFVIEQGSTYRLEVWGSASPWSRASVIIEP